MTYKVQQDGVVKTLSPEEAIENLEARCRCGRAGVVEVVDSTKEIPEIDRPGERKLRTGVNVWVRMSRIPRGHWKAAYILRLFEDQHAELCIPEENMIYTVPVDEHLTGRRGSTPV